MAAAAKPDTIRGWHRKLIANKFDGSKARPTPSRLLPNNGDGTFTDVSKESGIAQSLDKAFGVVATDVNNDGLRDLFVANDTVANFLFQNLGNGKLEEVGLWSGVAYS